MGSRVPRASVAVLALAIVLVTAAAAFVWLRLVTPSDGARLQPGAQVWVPDGIVITPITPQPSGGLQPGDVVTEVAGRSMESWAAALADRSMERPRWGAGETVAYRVLRGGRTLTVPVTLGFYPLGTVLRHEWGTLLFATLFAALSAFVFARRPAVPAARALLISSAGILAASTWSFGLQISDLTGTVGFWLYEFTTVVAYLLLYAGALHLTVVFPQPRPLLARRPWLVPAIYLVPYTVLGLAVLVAWRSSAGPLAFLAQANSGVGLIVIVYMALIGTGAVVAYRARADESDRRPIRWIALTTMAIVVLNLALGTIPELVLGRPLVSWNILALTALLVVAAIAAGILQHRLFGIDLLINRALVYGILTAIVVTIYVLVVGYAGALMRMQDSLTFSLLATGLVAVIFQPLRERLQRTVNRWMYGERDDPYAVIARLADQLESVVAPDAMLPALVETIAQTLKLPYVALTLHDDRGERVAASYGLPHGEPTVLSLVYQREPIGQLILSPRAANEPFAADELRLLDTIATHAGVAAHAVRLTADLQRSRERLVSAREEERRRLRRDLHDGLGPALAGITLKLDAARNLLAQDPAAADRLLSDLKVQTQSAIADIRRLVYELRPPALDELGLISALQEQINGLQANGLRISTQFPASLPPLPAAIEVAAYRIAQEALTNVIRHAHARECRVSIAISDVLEIEVVDDGVGLGSGSRAGIGLMSMRERTAELGGSCVIEARPSGGTRLVARLPLSGP